MKDVLTRTGSIREGFEYQDLYGVAVLIEWLEHPERYEWIAFEEDEFGFLDDVVRCTPDLVLTLSQVKHSGIPEASRFDVSLSELLKTNQMAARGQKTPFCKSGSVHGLVQLNSGDSAMCAPNC